MDDAQNCNDKGQFKSWQMEGECSYVFQGKKCNLCNCHFSALYKYYKHRIRCWRKLGFSKVCHYCGQEFYFFSLYRKHFATCWKSHRGRIQTKRISEINVCHSQEQAMDRISPLPVADDMLSTDKYPKTCPVCENNIRSLAHYHMHLKRKGLCRPKPYACKVCGKIFKKIHHLLSHEKRKTPCYPSLSKVPLKDRKLKGGKVSNEFPLSDQKVAKKTTDSFKRENNIIKSLSSVSRESETNLLKNIKKEKPYLRSSLMQNKSFPKKEFVCEKCGMIFKTRQFYFRHLMRSTPCDLAKAASKRISTKNITESFQFICASSPENSNFRFYRDCHDVYSSSNSVKNAIVPQSKLHERSNTTEVKVKQTARKSGPPTLNECKINVKNDTAELQNQSSYSSEQLAKESVENFCESPAQYWMAKSDNSESLVCDICHKMFSSFAALNRHVKKHPSRKKVKFAVKCPVCLQVFYSAYLLLCHQKNNKHWGKAAKSRTIEYKCPFCDKNFLYVQSRNTHIRSHLSERPQDVTLFLQQTTCDICLQPFVSEGIKLQHMKISHPDWMKSDLKSQCEHQSKGGISSMISEEDKNFITSQAKKTGYKKKAQRNAIVVTATIEALLKKHPNSCPVCKKIYCNTFVRDRHFKLHTMEKNFGCNLCSEKFFRSEHLTHHMQKIHNDQLMFECLGCGLRFPTRVHTIQHISKVHTDHARDSLVLERNVNQICVKNAISPPKVIKGNSQVESEESHEAVCHGSEDQKRFCEICQIKFAKATRLQRHRLSKMHQENFLYTQASPSVQPQPKSLDKLECSVCGQAFDTVACFVPHRLSHFNFKNMDIAEISDLNPYHCEICSKRLDHHQRVQIHLLWHLRASRFGAQTSPKINASYANHIDSGSNILKTEKKTGPQVAKKTLSNCLSKPVQNIPLTDVKKPLVTCDACNIGFTTKHHYTAHVRRYCQVRKMPASPDPDKLVSTRSSRLSSPKSKLPCCYCSLELSSVSDLKWHEKSCRKVHGSERDSIVSDRSQINCIECHCSFFDMEIFHEHKMLFCESNSSSIDPSHSQENDYWVENQVIRDGNTLAMCVPCKDHFTSLQSLINHLKACKTNSWGNDKVHHLVNDNQSHCDDADMKLKYKYIENSNHLPLICEETKGKFNMIESLQSTVKTEVTNQNENAVTDVRKDSAGNNMFKSNSVHNESKYVDGSIQLSCSMEEKSNPIASNKLDRSLPLDFSEKNTIKEVSLDDEQETTNVLVSSEGDKITEPDNDCLGHLRDNFSQLLYLLVADPELMQQLGWGQRLIDKVLEDVLQHMGQQPVDNCSGQTELSCLRENIQLLLQMCLKDQLISSDGGTNKSVDSIVVEVLELFKAGMEC